MNGNLRLDRDILIAAGTGMVSIIGICLVLLIGLRLGPEQSPVVQPTESSFKFQLLATETYTPDPSLITDVPGDDPFEEATVDPGLPLPDDFDPFGTPEEFPTLPEDTESLETEISPDQTDEPIATDDPSVDDEFLFQAGMYDDTDYRIDYIGDWSSELFVDNAHEESLFVSTSSGNTASFTFMGRQVVLGFLGSAEEDLGTAIVAIDGNPYPMNQSVGDKWSSPQLAFGEHSVVITHQDGDLLFIDYVDVR